MKLKTVKGTDYCEGCIFNIPGEDCPCPCAICAGVIWVLDSDPRPEVEPCN